MAETFGRLLPYRSGGWRIDLRPFGYLYTHEGMRFQSEAHAAGVLAAIRAEIAKGADPAGVVRRLLPRKGEQARVRVHLARWLEVQKARAENGERSPTYVRELVRYSRPDGYFGPLLELSIHSLTFGRLEDWLAGLKVSGKTKRNAADALRSFLWWLKRRGELTDPPAVPAVRVDEHLPQVITLEDQDRVVAAISEAARGAFLACRLGLRPNEVRALNVEDFADGVLRVAHGMKGPNREAPRRGPKSRRFRILEVDAELRDWIAAHRNKAFPLEPLFPNPASRRDNGRWTHGALYKAWKRGALSVGVGVSLYEGTKHSSASAAARRGVRLEEIQHALGHADVRSTARYARLNPVASVTVLRPR